LLGDAVRPLEDNRAPMRLLILFLFLFPTRCPLLLDHPSCH
jgi:hypothetical protein